MKDGEWYTQNQGVFEKLSKKVEGIIIEVLDDKKIEYHQVHSRVKAKDSFLEKYKNPKYTFPEDITDLAGIRVISYVESSIHDICRIIEENFTIDKENSHDKADNLGLDKVGYKSVHFVAQLPSSRIQLQENKKFENKKFEIQVRTILQHSWAEIEHDKNYKFSGELPEGIQRRFKLLAGLLELADNEFNSISKEIDNYTNEVNNRAEKGDLNIKINSTSLQEYLNVKLTKYLRSSIYTKFNIDQEIVNEIIKYGINTLDEFDKIVPMNLLEIYKTLKVRTTYLGLVRDILIINDYKKYFSLSYDGEWFFDYPDPIEEAVYEKFNLTIPMFNKEMEENGFRPEYVID